MRSTVTSAAIFLLLTLAAFAAAFNVANMGELWVGVSICLVLVTAMAISGCSFVWLFLHWLSE